MSSTPEAVNNTPASDDGPSHHEGGEVYETPENIEDEKILSFKEMTNNNIDVAATHVESMATANNEDAGGSPEQPIQQNDVIRKSPPPTVDRLDFHTQNESNQRGGEVATVTAESSEESVEKELTGEIVNAKDGENGTTQLPGSSQIAGEGRLATSTVRKSAATVDSPREIDSRRPSTRSRTRSLSSTAVSSISGEHSSVQSGGGSAGDGSNIDPIMLDDGNTPRRTNSFSSRGPMRKRHKQNTASRTLFRTNESRAVPSQEIDADSKNDGLLPRKFSSTSVTFSNARERSNTIDSFRAAMDYQANDYNLSAETIILPKMKDLEQHEGETETNFDENHHLLPSPRSRSDTIDFLTAAEFGSSSSIYADDMRPIPDYAINDVYCDNQAKVSIINETAPKCEETTESEQRSVTAMKVAIGKTPKIANRSREMSHSSESPSHGPLRKRHRTRSLSFALSVEGKLAYKTPKTNLDKNDQEDASAKDFHTGNENSEDDDATELGGCIGRKRSDTLDLFNDEIFNEKRRHRSDTMDFLTAAIAGDMGHDLDAAVAATADDGASFAMHHVSAPSGASSKYNARPPKRLRSDTLDSTASSINSAKLDFFVSVAAEQGVLTSPIYSGGGVGQKRSGSLASENSSDHPQRRPRSNTLEIYSNMSSARARCDTVDFLCGTNDDPVGNFDEGNVLDHLNSLCDEPKVCNSKTTTQSRLQFRSTSEIAYGLVSPRAKVEESSTTRKTRKNSEATWKTNLSQESINILGRNRLESWGGMSDLSAGGIGALAATHSALKDTGIMDDVLAAAADLGFDDISDGASSLERLRKSRTASEGSNSLSGHAKTPKGRPRLNSTASISLASLSDTSNSKLPAKKASKGNTDQPTKPSDSASVSTRSIFVDYDAIASAVHAANAATDGLDLSSILGTPSVSLSSKAIVDSTTQNRKNAVKTEHPHLHEKLSNTAAISLVKVTIDQIATETPTYQENAHQPLNTTQPKPPLITSKPTMTAAPQLAKATPDTNISGPHNNINAISTAPFPVTTINIPFVPIPESTKTKEEMDAIRERARAAAGYVPPGEEGIASAKKPPPRPPKTPSSSFLAYHPGMHTHIPFKKRGLPPFTPSGLRPDLVPSNIAHTPNACAKPPQTPSSALSSKSGTLQSQQKWDDMFECLVKFIGETREKSTRHMNEAQKAAWVWDGNVPTSHKTRCGKALGRWINNQRSAKAKDTLKDDREVRLVSTGLKWSVLTTNSWRQMLHELEIYVREQTKDGRPWDGNVPTNYKIKSSIVDFCPDDEEKNLGRWVNRQRSLFQAGKLKKDRQEDLEKIGLKWSVLLTTSWTTMYECLRSYAEEQQKQNPHGWDGNVQANFKTKTNPPLSLGRWVNRQRSAHAKGRLKEEYVKQLEAIGLKWVIHARNRTNEDDDDDDEEDDDFTGGEEFIPIPSIEPSNLAPLLNRNDGPAPEKDAPNDPSLPPSTAIASGDISAPKKEISKPE